MNTVAMSRDVDSEFGNSQNNNTLGGLYHLSADHRSAYQDWSQNSHISLSYSSTNLTTSNTWYCYERAEVGTNSSPTLDNDS